MLGLCGCRQIFGIDSPALGDAAKGSDGPPDVRDGPRDSASDSPVPICSTDAALHACYKFDGDATDSTAYANNATTAAVSYVAGHDGQAVSVFTGASITVPYSASLDVTTLTIEM